jgi:hypothetical protein
MTANPFHAEGEWVRAALHTHSTVSDGTLQPHRLAAAYQEAGFDVLAITDHWRLTEVEPTDRLITVPAAELGFDLAHPNHTQQSGEFLVYGIDHLPEDPGGDRANWMFNSEENWEVRTFASLTAGAQWAEAMGAVVYVAHPYWNGLSVEDLHSAEGFSGLEVFNGSAQQECGRGDSSPWWDALLGRGRRMFGIATDDQHYPLFELGVAWTMLKVRDRTPVSVVEALRTGAAYFSHGPTIHEVTVVDGGVEVTCSPVRSVVLHRDVEFGTSVSVGRGGRHQGRVLQRSEDGLITRALLDDPEGAAMYRRVTVTDTTGARAWTNPF